MFTWLFDSSVEAPRWVRIFKRQLSIRGSILLAYLAIVGGGFYMILDTLMKEIGPRYLESMEESLVDTVNILASAMEYEFQSGNTDAKAVQDLFERAYQRPLNAKIYSLEKREVDLRVYVTDENGVVLYDSHTPENIGSNYGKWIDVSRTLRGEYGARATRMIKNGEPLLVLYVAAPIYVDGEVAGVVSVGKPTTYINELIRKAERRVRLYGTGAAFVILVLGVVLSIFLTRPIRRLIAYAQAVRDGENARLPRLFGMEANALGQAFEEMKDALEGKQYVEEYAQSLTHQLKSPLSGISGAAELLEGEMSPEERARFLGNVRRESERMRRVIDRMLELAALEVRKELRNVEEIDLLSLVGALLTDLETQLASSYIAFDIQCEPEAVSILGERFLIRQALTNLLQNAIEFSPMGSQLEIQIKESSSSVECVVINEGERVPDYALERVFERFYSLPRPATGQKSSGIGLSYVREIMIMHGGNVSLQNREDGRVEAKLVFRRS
ncbi:two-component system sensor histidine kinase CreC [Puniceicoccaceae bacterium K14]|nr:two-component system sensor histidine kinase CreC [Puniceicoccaceae bacterium K14]